MTLSNGALFQQDNYGIRNTGSTETATVLSNARTGLSNQDFNWHVSVYGTRRLGQGLGTMHAFNQNSGTAIIRIFFDDSTTCQLNGNGVSVVSASTDTHGFFIGTRTSNSLMSFYRNGLFLNSNTTTVSAQIPSNQLYACGSLTANTQYSQYISFITVGFGLNDNQCKTLYDIVERFNTRLGRSCT